MELDEIQDKEQDICDEYRNATWGEFFKRIIVGPYRIEKPTPPESPCNINKCPVYAICLSKCRYNVESLHPRHGIVPVIKDSDYDIFKVYGGYVDYLDASCKKVQRYYEEKYNHSMDMEIYTRKCVHNKNFDRVRLLLFFELLIVIFFIVKIWISF